MKAAWSEPVSAMSASETMSVERNGLDALVAGMSLLLGLFLLVGGSGHLTAIVPRANGSMALLLPGLILLSAAGVNLLASLPLARGRRSARWLLLSINAPLAVYLAWLLQQDVPDHPIGVFLAMVCSQLIVLLAVLSGMNWAPPEP